MTYMFRTIGQVLGVAFSSALLQASLDAFLGASALPADIVALVRKNTSAIHRLPAAQRDIAVAGYAYSLHRVFVLNAVLAGLTVLALACIDNVHMPERSEDSASEDDE